MPRPGVNKRRAQAGECHLIGPHLECRENRSRASANGNASSPLQSANITFLAAGKTFEYSRPTI
jgi:hypothetical protein